MTVEELQAQLDAERQEHAEEIATIRAEHEAEVQQLNAQHEGALAEQRKIIDKLMTQGTTVEGQGEKTAMQSELDKINKKRG